MMRSKRRGATAAAMVCALGLAAGCQNRGLTTGGVTGGTAQIEATLLTPGETFETTNHTVLLMKSAKRRFRVLTGPLDKQWFELSGRDPQAQGQDAYMMVGTMQNSDPAWELDQGYSLMWGYWPVAWTKTVSIGAEGTTVLVVAEGTTEYVVLADGRKATIRRRASLDPMEPVLATISTADQYVKIVNGAVVYGPSPVPADPMDPLRAMLNSAIARQQSVEP